MGRFNDLWASGKFAVKRNEEFEESRQQEARDMARELSPDLAVPVASRDVFDALKAKRGQETGRWLNGLIPDAVERPIESLAAGATAFEEVSAWIDKLCKEFVELAYEFNKKAIGTNLYISYEKPRLYEKKSDDVWYRPVEKTYKGRLTTRDWALVVRGRDEKIAIFVIPSAMVMAFDNDSVGEDEIPPFMEVKRITGNTGHTWVIGGEIVPLETMPQLAKELLGDLIRVSSGVMSESELFNNHATPTLGENIAVGYKAEADETSSGGAPDSAAAGGAQTDARAQAMALATAKDTAGGDQIISKACDIVDEIIDEELKSLYSQAGKHEPGSAEAVAVRRKISATETFHTKILDAFKEYTHSCLLAQDPPAANKPKLSK